MQQISNTYQNLLQAISLDKSIVVNEDGSWYERDWLTALFVRLLGNETASKTIALSRIATHIQKLSIKQQTSLDEGVKSPKNSGFVREIITEVQRALNQIYKNPLANLAKLKAEAKTESVQYWDLVTLKEKIGAAKRKLHAFYMADAAVARTANMINSLGNTQDNIDQVHVREDHRDWLNAKVNKFQKKQKIALLRPESADNLNIKIERALHYPQFIEAMKTNPLLLDSFVKAICRASPHGSAAFIDIYVQMPYVQQLLTKSFLDKRIQKIANNGLAFSQTESGGKQAELLIHGTYQPISNLSRDVTTGENKSRTVASLFKEFARLNDKILDIEYVQTGVEEGDFQLKKFDFNQDRWWLQLPDIEIQSLEWVQNKFKDDSITADQPLVVLHSTRLLDGLSLNDTHSFIDIYIPKGDGTFNIISPGKFGDTFIPTVKEKGWTLQVIWQQILAIFSALKTVFSTQGGIYVLADQNNYMSHRHHLETRLPISNEQFIATMDFIKHMFVEAREGRLIFQPQADNCTSPLQELVQRLYPGIEDPFRTPFLRLNPPPIFKWMKDTRKFFQTDESWNSFRKRLTYLLGSSTPRKYRGADGSEQQVAVRDNADWQVGMMPHPGVLFDNKIRERFERNLSTYAV